MFDAVRAYAPPDPGRDFEPSAARVVCANSERQLCELSQMPIDHRTFVTAVRTVLLRSGARRKCPTLYEQRLVWRRALKLATGRCVETRIRARGAMGGRVRLHGCLCPVSAAWAPGLQLLT